MNGSNEPEPWSELDDLIANCVDDDYSPEEREKLNQILRDNPDAQRHAVQTLFNESLIRGQIRVAQGEEIYGVPKKVVPPWWKQSSPWIGAAAAITVLVGWTVFSGIDDDGNESVAGEESVVEKPIAAVVQLKGDHLLGASNEPVEVLDVGSYRMAEGSAELVFRNGVQAVIEGPIDFTIESDMRMILRSGRIRARVPSNATGFTIDAPEVDVVDLGTEFGVYVNEDRETQVHVFSGEVELHEEDRGDPRIVTEGFAANWREGEKAKDFSEPDPGAFLTSGDLRKEERRLLQEELMASPDTVAYFDFVKDEGTPSVLQNRVDPGITDGEIIGSTWVQGRAPGKGALQFEYPGDRVAIMLPMEFPEITLSVWAKLDRLDSSLTAIFNADGFSAREYHWQIMDDGAVLSAAARIFRFASPDSVIVPGQWMHLVTTYDSEENRNRCFVNGELVLDRVAAGEGLPLRFGQANLGHWGQPLGWPKKRGFRGRMDEFFVQKRAMTPEEVRRVYEVGKPVSW